MYFPPGSAIQTRHDPGSACPGGDGRGARAARKAAQPGAALPTSHRTGDDAIKQINRSANVGAHSTDCQAASQLLSLQYPGDRKPWTVKTQASNAASRTFNVLFSAPGTPGSSRASSGVHLFIPSRMDFGWLGGKAAVPWQGCTPSVGSRAGHPCLQAQAGAPQGFPGFQELPPQGFPGFQEPPQRFPAVGNSPARAGPALLMPCCRRPGAAWQNELK